MYKNIYKIDIVFSIEILLRKNKTKQKPLLTFCICYFVLHIIDRNSCFRLKLFFFTHIWVTHFLSMQRIDHYL